ncbi:hypothetical protein O0I10_008530 [Lichtheimia ornata]|uniref:CNH domain-containing protein n=1 Tax=Lichtheimia ornata TaxID=688661 RepID=A0AAD7XWY7_9FUNG|nr:uncharacterized protein O0I10_008530 [Lichtheimia ornata]KAJ8655866.1 hypothetical protein O0I10_008530 [Lichtheimia ornata]
MPFTPYTSQTILPSANGVVDQQHASIQQQQQQQQPTSFFTRRPTAPSPVGSPPDVNPSLPPSPPSRFNTLLPSASNAASTSFTIDAVEAWDTNLYLGTSDGCVLHFILEEQSKPGEVPYASRLENKINLGFGRKSIERILVIPQVSKAVVLCDSTLSFYWLPAFAPIPVSSIPHIKGVSCFAHNVAEEGRIGEDGTIELCVVKRRVLQIYKVGELVQIKKEMPLPDGAITLARHGRNLCLADYNHYKLINLLMPNPTPLIPTPQVTISSPTMLGAGSQTVPKPVLTVIRPDEFLVVSGSIFTDSHGSPIRGTLQWASYPKALCVEFPYIAALLRNGTIEIHNILDQRRLQVITFPQSFEARGMSFGHGIKVWMESMAERLRRRPYAHINDEELESDLKRQVSKFSTVPARILIHGRDSVAAQIVTPLVVQVDNLLDDRRLEEALDMADQARNTMSTENNVYVERMQSELDYIYQKAGLLLLQETVFEDAFTLLSKGNIDPRMVIHLFSDLAASSRVNESPYVLLFDGVYGLLERTGRIEDMVAKTMERNYSPHLEEDHQRSSPTMELRRVLLRNAREALEKYLTIERGKRRMLIGKGDTVCKAIDTALLKLFVTNDQDDSIHRLLERPNDCSLEDCVNTLIRSKKYYALSILYQSKHMYEKVLETLTKIYMGELPDTRFTNGLEQIKRLLLRDISPEHLPMHALMQYAWWVTEQNPVDGVEIFVRSPRAKEMDSSEILEKLEQFGDEAVRSYLDYLVTTRKSKEPKHHTRLALTYVRSVILELEAVSKDTLHELVEEYKQTVNPSNVSENEMTFVGYLGAHQQSSLVRRRLLLIRLLQRSELYDPGALLEAIEKAGPLDIEKVIVYGRMKRHEDALRILIHDLGDFVGAETYCVTKGQSTGTVPAIIMQESVTPARTSSLSKKQVVKKKQQEEDAIPLPELPEENDERRALFSMLLQTYLSIKDSQLMLVRTMHLLTTQGYYLDILEVLDLIPDDWPIQMLQDFLIRSLRRSLHDHRNSQIVVSLSRGENVMANSQVIDLYKDIGPIYVDPQSECHKCHQYLGDSIVVREHRHGHLLHLTCAKAAGLVKADE